MQIVLYPAIACLHIWASSGRTEIIVSAVFLGALALVVVFVSIGAHGLLIGIMFMANVVAISFHCIWKLYTVAQPWLHRHWRRKLYPIAQPWLLQYFSTLAPAWLMHDEEAGRLLLPLQQGRAAFRMREFSYDELRIMTQDFRSMVGQGGFAQVFRGVLLDDDGTGTAVAIKRITTTGGGGGDRPPVVAGDDDFLREISIVSNVHHRSLVRLLGYCLPREGLGSSSRYLVYPFFDNGSLDSWLFHGTQERRRLLPWPTRRCIAVDVAKALAYLHHECWQQILHLDVKPGNILLDADLRAHLSDFGISMSITRDMSSVDTRGRGTPGYMAPEMLVNAVSAKSDVFSYGMTLLELVGGRRNFDPASSSTTDDASSSATPDFTRDFFPYIVRDKMARGELMEAVDAAMALVDREEVEAVVKVALCCIQSRWDMRPTMLTVVDMLEGRVAADLPLQSRHLSTVNFSDLLSSSSLTHGQ
ncbi:probable receptor-like protein kinase At5g20050 [Miscanthus floridulus]|uniref:probable receptor-like protein kinase At5g20050 n=1 Tax=Miscanthus floridulus TaxID=154761 RepID=UPI00345B3979